MSEKSKPSPTRKPSQSKGRSAADPTTTSKASTPKPKAQAAPPSRSPAKPSTSRSASTRTAAPSTPPSTPKRSTRAAKPVAEYREPGILNRIADFLSDPELFRKLRGQLPSWSDELGAFALIILGVLTLSSLFGSSGDIAAPLADGLSYVFGKGAFIVALSVMALGVIMLLPKAGIYITFSWVRILALEVVFLSIQGLLHLAEFSSEGRAIAREGNGGGHVGWAVSSLLLGFLSHWLSIVILSFIALIGFGIVLGIRREDIRHSLLRLSESLQATAANMRPKPRPVSLVQAAELYPDPVLNNATPDSVAQATSPYIEQTVAADIPLSQVPPANEIPSAVLPTPPAASVTPPASIPAQRLPKEIPLPSETRSQRRQAPPPPPPSRQPSVANTVVPVEVQTTPSNGGTIPNPSPEPVESKPLPWEMAPPPAPVEGSSTPKFNGKPQPTPIMPAQLPDLDADILEDVEDDEFIPNNVVVEQAPRLIINGQEVILSAPSSDRPSLLSQPEAKPSLPSRPRPMAGFAAKTSQRRHFVVDGFQDKVKIGKRGKDLPPLELLEYSGLKLPSEEEVNTNARIIENTMMEFDIDADVIDVRVGPTVTQYAVSPIKEVVNENGETSIIRTRVSKIASLSSDLALALSTKTLRIEAPVPGHSYVGIEVPNSEPSIVALRSVMESEIFYNERKKPLSAPLGRDVSGECVVVNLALMPHLLVAGTTGSGKSIFLRSLITSLIMNNTPDQLRMIILDPKMVEFTQFNGIPHLLGPVETDTERIIGVLRWAAREMDRRYKLLELEKARNIESYNEILGRRRRHEHMPYMVLIVDEIGDLMMSRPDETEKTLTRLAQKARAAGMHLVVATQRPSVDVITGLIKANFPARVSFAVAAGVDSRVILDTTGADALVGKGDMLFLGPDAAGPKRIQGCYVSDTEVDALVAYWRNWHQEQLAEEKMESPVIAPWESAMTRLEELSQLDPVLEEALTTVVSEGQASVSLLQRRLGVGYPRAAHLMDSLYELGIIGSPRAGGKSREVLVKSVDEARRMIHNNRRKKTY